jgi:DNA polymerase I-like protein with 3'-5' exonuclease and polymerase domains
MSESGPSQSVTEYTEKQKKLIDACSFVISQEGIKLVLVPPSLAFLDNPVAVDVEHDEQGNFVCVGVCHGKQCDVFIEITPVLKAGLEEAKIIAHNGVTDLELLRMWGANVKDEQLVHDTMLIGHLLDSSLKSYGLKDMAKRELGISYPSYEEIVGKRGLKAERITLDKQPIELVSRYNALDCYTTYKLYERQKKAMGI